MRILQICSRGQPAFMAFFSTTALGPGSAAFRGRQAELARLLQLCHDEVTVYVALYGGRQNGKTSLLRRLEAALGTTVRACRVNFQLIKGADPTSAFAYVGAEIARRLPFGPEPALVQDGPALKQLLNERLAHPEAGRFVLILDEWGALPKITRENLANTLRAIFDTRFDEPQLAKLQVIFSGGVELYALMLTDASSLHAICEPVYLADLTEAEAVALVSDGLRDAGVDPERSVELGRVVYAQVVGHPYLTQRLGRELEQAVRSGALPGQGTIDATMAKLKADDSLLRRIRDDLHEQALEDAARRLLSDPPRFSRFDDAFARLELIGLAKRDGAFWAPRNPLLAAVFRELLGVPAPAPVTPQPPPESPAPDKMPRQAFDAPVQSAAPAPVRSGPVRTQGKPEPKVSPQTGSAAPATSPTAQPRPPAPRVSIAADEWVQREPVNPGSSTERASRAKQQPQTGIPRNVTFGALAALLAIALLIVWARFGGTVVQPEAPTAMTASSPAPVAVASQPPVADTAVVQATAVATPAPTTPTTRPLPAWVPTLVEVPAGPFLMGSADTDTLADSDEKPQHTLELPAYWIGKTEVTNAQFRPFVEGDGYTNRAYWTEAGWAWREQAEIVKPGLWDDPQWNGDDQPVVGVSWFEAVAYVRWLSAQTGHEFRLPSEAEWEKAARGPEGLIWPWGNTWDAVKFNNGQAVGKTTPVGQYPGGASPYGALDMAGNAWEWCATQSGKGYPYQLENEWAEAYLEVDSGRTIRGGAWYVEQKYVRGAYRYDGYYPRDRVNEFGLRVASHSPLPGSDS